MSTASFLGVMTAGALGQSSPRFGRLYLPVIRLHGRIVWRADRAVRGYGARQEAICEAERALNCDPGSLMAEELSKILEAAS